MTYDPFDRAQKRINTFFWTAIVLNIIWCIACCYGVFLLGRALIEYLGRY